MKRFVGRAPVLLLAAGVACASVQEPRTQEGFLAESRSRYEQLEPPKALAAAVDGGYWAYGIGTGPTEDAARRRAIQNCERYREQSQVESRCSVRYVDEVDVWALSDAVAEFPHYSDHKALWLAGTPDRHLFSYVHSFPAQDEANRAAMGECRRAARPLGLDDSCRICAIGQGVPCTLTEPAWDEGLDLGR